MKGMENFALTKKNYVLMVIGIVVLFIGFMLMTGGGSTDPNVFNAEELYSFRRITLAPIVVLLGFAFEIYAIMKKFDQEPESSNKNSK